MPTAHENTFWLGGIWALGSQYTRLHSSILLFSCLGGNFTCPEGKVLPSAKVCDTIPDCKNAEDEYECDYQATSDEQDLSLNEEDLSLLDNYDEEDLDKFVEEFYDIDEDLDGIPDDEDEVDNVYFDSDGNAYFDSDGDGIPDDVDLVDNREGVESVGNGTDWFDAK